MGKRKTLEEFKQEVYDLVKDEYTILSNEYKNNKTKIKIRHNCKTCNNYEYEVTPTHFLAGCRCPKCAIKNQTKTDKEFKQEVFDLVGNEYTFLESYSNCHSKLLVRHNCDKCNNYKWKIRADRFIAGDRCPKCAAKNQTKTDEEFKQEVFNLVGDEYTFLEVYSNCHSKLLVRHNCDKCNNYEYSVQPNDFLRGYRCPKCANVARINNDQFKEKVYNLVGDEYTVLTEYNKCRDIITFKHNCDKCDNYEFDMKARDFLYKNERCPRCSLINQSSKAEKEIANYIKSIYDKTIEENNRTILEGQELDIYLPDIKLAIEYNGYYYHDKNHRDKYYHLNKYNNCKEKGIILITIWEDEYLNEKNKYFNILRQFINKEVISYNIKYENNYLYVNKEYENLKNIIYNNRSNINYEYVGDVMPELIARNNHECWNLGWKIYKKI